MKKSTKSLDTVLKAMTTKTLEEALLSGNDKVLTAALIKKVRDVVSSDLLECFEVAITRVSYDAVQAALRKCRKQLKDALTTAVVEQLFGKERL